MNRFKQKLFSYFCDNKVLSYITIVCFALMLFFWVWDAVYKINNYFQELPEGATYSRSIMTECMYLFQDIVILIFIISLVGVYLSFSPKLKLLILFLYIGTYAIYEVILKIYSIRINGPLMRTHVFIWTIGCFVVIGINAILLLCLNNRCKSTFLIITFIILNICINMSSIWQSIYLNIGWHYSGLKRVVRILQRNFKIYFVFICIAVVVILLFIPIFKNQCPQCGFKNTKQAKFCGKCGHNLTEKVFNLPFKK